VYVTLRPMPEIFCQSAIDTKAGRNASSVIVNLKSERDKLGKKKPASENASGLELFCQRMAV
jgi:hypothetical protein